MTKKIILTTKEFDRADDGWTIIRRKQSNGKYWIAAVHVETGDVHLQGEIVDSKEEVFAQKKGCRKKKADVSCYIRHRWKKSYSTTTHRRVRMA